MYFSRSFIVSALVGLGAATTHMGEGASSTGVAASETLSTSSAAAAATGAAEGMVATHVIQVGGPNGSLTFSPENIKANVGDLVQFQFHPKNHSVVQSTFDQPCVPIQNVAANVTNAFFSGFMPTNASVTATSNILTYTIRVMDSKPVWFYCSQAKHCQGGMVGAINAAETGNKTMAAFKALAAQAPANLSPGQASSGSGAASPSGGAGASTTTAAGGGGESTAPSSTASSGPAEQTVNAAPGLHDATSQSLFGLTVGVFATFFML
ncbi:hypothetical protein K458DRAFT_368330 [Lentithecium fluviatile CBS 122367]|uniref:Cupredoxin n=1 Tax=Lentithecium fluviatile CBS 122367 TaxID=1168545 RepID=A0A6G1J0W8_9PLEO|nr:hypothetical protein K458DRAFT_368330 [Lentithecium fluviatile CBS 122367]